MALELGEIDYQAEYPDLDPVAVSNEWWFPDKPDSMPRLLTIDNPTVFDPVAMRETDVDGLRIKFADDLADYFDQAGCETLVSDGHSKTGAFTTEHTVIINPVILGKLPPSAQEAIKQAPPIPEFAAELCDVLPEFDGNTLAIIEKGKAMGLTDNLPDYGLHPNFTNAIFVEDNDGDLAQLMVSRSTYDHAVLFNRMEQTKLGAFRNVIVPYQTDGHGNVKSESMVLGTLEGGHPTVSTIPDLARRLMIFGSASDMSVRPPVLDSVRIQADRWSNNPTVTSVKDIGSFLGEYDALSEPVQLVDLVKDKRLARKIAKALAWGRQAEGAVFAVDLTANLDLEYDPGCDGIGIVTASGRYGADKTNLGDGDIVPIVPTGELSIARIRHGHGDSGPSVEAEEFLLPNIRLAQKFQTRVRQEGGRFFLDPEGELLVPPYRAVVHVHRGALKTDNHFAYRLPTDVHRFPPVGCGVDFMHAMSEYAMEQGLGLIKAIKGRHFVMTSYVPNHGLNIYVPWSSDRPDGELPVDAFTGLKQAMIRGSLVLERYIPQV